MLDMVIWPARSLLRPNGMRRSSASNPTRATCTRACYQSRASVPPGQDA